MRAVVDGLLLDLERKLDVLAQVPPGQEVRVLEHHPDLRGSRPDDRAAVEQDLAAGQGVQPRHRPEQRRLPAAARPENADQLAGRDVEREVVRVRGRGRSSLRRSSSRRGSRASPPRRQSSKPPLLVGVRVLHELDHRAVDDGERHREEAVADVEGLGQHLETLDRGAGRRPRGRRRGARCAAGPVTGLSGSKRSHSTLYGCSRGLVTHTRVASTQLSPGFTSSVTRPM